MIQDIVLSPDGKRIFLTCSKQKGIEIEKLFDSFLSYFKSKVALKLNSEGGFYWIEDNKTDKIAIGNDSSRVLAYYTVSGLTTGNEVVINNDDVILYQLPFLVFRNGILTTDYDFDFVARKFTFSFSFQDFSNGSSSTEILIVYYKSV